LSNIFYFFKGKIKESEYFGACKDFVNDLKNFCDNRDISLIINDFQTIEKTHRLVVTFESFELYRQWEELNFYLNVIGAKNNLKLLGTRLYGETWIGDENFSISFDIILEENA